MSSHWDYDDGVPDDPWVIDDYEEGELEDDRPSFDPLAVASQYHAANAEGRQALWRTLDDDQRATLAGIGITGPVSTFVIDGFEVVPPTDSSYGRTMQQARAKVAAGLSAVQKGELDITPELAERITALAVEADRYPDDRPERAHSLQTAAHLLQRAEQAQWEAVPFDAGNIKKTHSRRTADGYVVTETDYSGRERVTHFDGAELDEAAVIHAAADRPWGDHPDRVSLDDYLSWPAQARIRYSRQFPQYQRRMRDQISSYFPGDGQSHDLAVGDYNQGALR